MKNLQELPKFADKLSYLYIENAAVDKKDKAVAIHQADGSARVPAASLALLLLGPGTKITHAAVRALADNNCQIVWLGQHGVRFYAHGLGGSRHSRNLIRQAQLVCDPVTRLQVVVRMYALRFDEPPEEDLTLQQLRGKEGVRVRQAYAQASQIYNVPWNGRNYHRGNWDRADPVNRALSAANACLYGLVHAAVVSGGYSPALGFIHTGKQLSFVYDIADLYKAEYTIPVAFAATAEGTGELERRVRLRLRDTFYRHRLMEHVLPDIAHVFDVPREGQAAQDEFAADPALPADLWDGGGLGTDMPIGKILKLAALFEGTEVTENTEHRTPSRPKRLPATDHGQAAAPQTPPRERPAHDRTDPGEGDTLSAG